MTPAMTPAPNDACESFWFLDGHCTVRLSARSNPDGLSMLEMRLPHRSGPPLHVHHDEDEVFHVLEGRVRLQVGERTHELAAGEVGFGPRGVPHGFRVVSPEGARMAVFTRGGGFERMVRSVSRPCDGLRLPEPEPMTPEMQAMLGAACEAERISLLGPPID